MADPLSSSRGIVAHHATWLPLVSFILAFAAFNAVLSPGGRTPPGVPEWLAGLLIGAFLAQPVLLSAWAALGPGSIIHRAPLALAALIALVFAEAFRGLNILQEPRELYELYLSQLVGAVAMFAVSTIVLLLLRRWAKVQIARPSAIEIAQSPKTQFGMKYLLGWMTLCAMFFAIGRLMAHGARLGDTPWLEAASEVASIVGIMLLIVFPPLALSLLALAHPVRLRVALVVLLIWAPALWAAVEVITVANSGVSRVRTANLILSMQIGATIAGTASAAVLRLAGYRLVKSTHAHSKSTVSAS